MDEDVQEPPPAPQPAPIVDGTPREIADGVFVVPDGRVPLVPNVGIVLGEERALVVDTGMGPANGARVRALAEELAGGRPLVLTLTHFHPEHGFGAQAFGGVTMVYNRAQLDELHEKGRAYLEMFRTFGDSVAEQLQGVELVDPGETYDGGVHRVDLGGRSAELHDVGRAHTRGDQVVFLPEERILFTGDLVEERIFPIYPYFPPEDADVDGSRWIDVLRELEALEPEQVVVGHGDVGGVGVISTAREYHQLLRRRTLELAADGLDADETVARLEPEIQAAYEGWEQPEWVAFGIRSFHATRAIDRLR